MTTYTPEQYALAAMLVLEAEVRTLHHGESWAQAYSRTWQPTADTEAGRSDALVLLAAVMRYLYVAEDKEESPGWVYDHWNAVDDALLSGNAQRIQHATFAAAVAIGKHIKG